MIEFFDWVMTNSKRKITDIFEEKVVSRKERNENGEWEVIERSFRQKRPVKAISEPLRLLHFYLDGFVFGLATISIDLFIANQSSVLSAFLTLFLYLAYYSCFEYFFQRTPAKFINGSLVVNEYGERPDVKSIFFRTISRLIPFEPFSFFWTEDKRFWHDSLSKTYVVSKDELALINKILSGEKLGKLDKEEWHNWQ